MISVGQAGDHGSKHLQGIMDYQKNVIVYLAVGDRYINQALFSIITFTLVYRKSRTQPKIIVFTDRPAAFLWLADVCEVDARAVSHDQLDEWIGGTGQTLRSKIRVIQDVLTAAEVNLLYVDTDTIFLKKVDELFFRISTGDCIMHTREWLLSYGRRLHLELCPQDVQFKLKHSFNVRINDQTSMWNSGVVGVSSGLKNEIKAVLELNDAFYQKYPTWHVEQLAFSVILSGTGRLSDAKKQIFHYWHNKDVADQYIQNLQSVPAGAVQAVLHKAAGDRRILVVLIWFKYKSLELKKNIRSLPGVYKTYLFFKPLLKARAK